MIKFVKRLLYKIIEFRKKRNLNKLYKQRLDELKKRDPFIYKH